MVAHMKEVARDMEPQLQVRETPAGWLFWPPAPEWATFRNPAACTRAVGVFRSSRGVEFNCAVLRDLGGDELADELIDKLKELSGNSLRGRKCPAVSCDSLDRNWPRARAEVIEPYFRSLIQSAGRIGGKVYRGRGERARQGAVGEDVEWLIRGRAAGQAFTASAQARHAIEVRAMEVAARHFEDRNWSVEDVSDHESYDLRCTRNAELVRVEVKGTAGGAAAVIVTASEVRVAQQNPAQSALAVVHGIVSDCDANGQWHASGGHLRIMLPWDPVDSRLDPIAYRYSLPPASVAE
jgi:hypothetical protein